MTKQYITALAFRFLPVLTITSIIMAVFAVGDVSAQTTDAIGEGVEAVSGPDGNQSLGELIAIIIQILLFIIGAISVIVIIIGGIMYTTSAGDTGKMTTAKNTILYAVVGLVVAILAYAIVNFILDAFA